MALSLTAFLVSVVFCLGATYNERRDRTILFWKSLPVSDTTTVLAKAAVPFVVMPIVALASILVAEAFIGLASIVILSAGGVSSALPWTAADIAGNGAALAYGLVVDVLWLGPIFAWLMLVAGWSRRGPFLWAVIPPLALCLLERAALGTHYLWTLLSDRLSGAQFHAFHIIPKSHGMGGNPKVVPGLAGIDLAKLLSDPGLWIGLILTAAMLALAIWLRRRRDPI
jgi:ABC-2 type transport system permease protein